MKKNVSHVHCRFSLIAVLPLTLWLVAAPLMASPVPGFGSSVLADTNSRLYMEPLGIFMQTSGTQWQSMALDATELQIHPNAVWIQRWSSPLKNSSTTDLQASVGMSLHLFSVNAQAKMEVAIKKWMKEYANLGFEVLDSRPHTVHNLKGLLVDFIHRKKNMQQRQLIFKYKNRLAILTCTASVDNFSVLISPCNDSLKTFRFL